MGRAGRVTHLVVGVGGRGDWEEDEEREGGERGAAGGGHWRSEGRGDGRCPCLCSSPRLCAGGGVQGSGQGKPEVFEASVQLYKLQARRAAAVEQTTRGDRQVFLFFFLFCRFFLEYLLPIRYFILFFSSTLCYV